MEPSSSSQPELESKELFTSIIEQEQARTIESRVDENTFVDKTSGRLFRRYQYFGYRVIQDIETGFINAGSFVLSVTGGNKHLSKFRRVSDFHIAIELTRELIKNDRSFEHGRFRPGFSNSEIEAYMLRVYNEGFGDDVKGTYVPIPVFQLVALWADKKHKLEVLVLLANINDKAYTQQLAYPETPYNAYDEMKCLNEELVKETEFLASTGVKELIIVAQDVTKYGADLYGEPKLVKLLQELEKIKDLKFNIIRKFAQF